MNREPPGFGRESRSFRGRENVNPPSLMGTAAGMRFRSPKTAFTKTVFAKTAFTKTVFAKTAFTKTVFAETAFAETASRV
ncbi:hypothetical protein [Streptosporangium sp. NPDC051022]|uniref:hypothetical protein n=1 Tax=Streptosporangium sp. NPDC051022 TaxID=3155752 RepID=UPI00344505F9